MHEYIKKLKIKLQIGKQKRLNLKKITLWAAIGENIIRSQHRILNDATNRNNNSPVKN